LFSVIRSQGVCGGRSCDEFQPLLIALCQVVAVTVVLIDAFD